METTPALWLTLIGLAIVCVALVNGLLRKLRLPALVGYILIGFTIRVVDQRWPLLSPPVEHAFSLLASIGIVTLLFRVGLDSNPRKLMRELPLASIIGIGNLAVSGLVGF
ncbi:Sodium/hydrogen exchanger family protein [Thiohalomonas denitrificans]|uniref:Sodium/hydrogen exchanger family protein n=1 Tax=Thiohalomonas denitrificans TaxID=415747 RepID=A0A1G5Q4F2_9GAMM|nr:Sodium/hydrogen exchanger family protein [Thiohalomonas denitrificans]